MTVEELTNTLVSICEADESTDYVDELLTAAKAALTAGNGQLMPFTSGGANGRNFSADVRIDCGEMIRACIDAIKIYNCNETPQFTVPSFHRMNP